MTLGRFGGHPSPTSSASIVERDKKKKPREKSTDPIISSFSFPIISYFFFFYLPLSRKLFLSSSFLLRLYSYFLSCDSVCVCPPLLEERRNQRKDIYSSIITTLASLGLPSSSLLVTQKWLGRILSRVSVVYRSDGGMEFPSLRFSIIKNRE